jgi:hypothetical protein
MHPSGRLRSRGETVEKLIYLLWRRPEVGPEEFGDALRGPVAERLFAIGAPRLTVHLVDEAAGAVSKARITHLEAPPDGAASFWLDSADDRHACQEALARVAGNMHGYLVSESVAIPNDSHRAPEGERTPGITMLALLERPARLGREAWLERWLDHHRAVAMETQCTYLYVRNVVVRRLTPEAKAYEGIVEEGFPEEAVTDPMRWYCTDGSQERLRANLSRMIESCKTFLDLDRVESHPMSEYIIRA